VFTLTDNIRSSAEITRYRWDAAAGKHFSVLGVATAQQKIRPVRAWFSLIFPALVATAWCCRAAADGVDTVERAFSATKPLVDLRLRSESVDQDGLPEDASALTLRGRVGFETGEAWGFKLLAEAELLWPLSDDYNDTINGKTQFPIVADPEAYEVNRLQLANTSIPDTTLVLGRQRISYDDQRFVDNVAWRQNEQTFDALRVTNKSVRGLTIDLAYLNQVNRVVGSDSPVGRYTGDNYLANVSYDTPVGKFTGFAYLLDFQEAATDSTATIGVRYAAQRVISGVKLVGFVSYADQQDRAANPLDYSTQYFAAELAGTLKGWTAAAGIEVLGGDGVRGFSTPLATLHKFQGWADKFLTTPVNGIDDRYLSLGYSKKPLGPLDSLSALVVYHLFESERLSLDYGSEANFLLQARWRRFTALLKYADYRADGFATDTRKFWIQLEFAH